MKILALLFVVFLTACDSEYYPPAFVYRASFDITDANKIETYAKELANARGFRVFEKSREEMKGITNGKEAFFIAFYNGGKLPIFTISNAGTGIVLSIMISINDDFKIDDANELAARVKEDLKCKFNINLELKESKE